MANFRLAPGRTGGKPAAGEGHLHLYVDGRKLTRLYGPWFYLEGLGQGAHALRVEAVAHNHAPYHRDGSLSSPPPPSRSASGAPNVLVRRSTRRTPRNR